MQWVKRTIICLLPLIALAAWIGFVTPAEGQGSRGYRVIANKDLSLTEMSKAELSRIFLKKLTRFNGVNLEPADQDPGATVRETFSRDVHNRPVNAIKSYWQRQIFSGRGTPPPELSNDSAVVSHVNSTSGGIGYVSEGVNPGSSAVVVQVLE